MFIRGIHCNQQSIKYLIKSLAINSENGEIFIVYKLFPLICEKNKNNSEIWIKPLLNFKKILKKEDIIEFENQPT